MKLTIDNLCVDRASFRVIDRQTLSAKDGDAVVFTGRNGAGKSTLLRAIAGLLPVSNGSVALSIDQDGTIPPGEIREYCHYLGHKNGLKSALSVRENLGFWQNYCSNPEMAIEEALEAVDLLHTLHSPAGYLSAGQKRRVAIARLLITRKPIWIVDEPTSGLDEKAAQTFSKLANNHCTGGGILIAATHLPLKIRKAKTINLEPTSQGVIA